MTSHYMLCNVSYSFEQLFDYLGKYFGGIHTQAWTTSEGRVAVVFGESYFFRVNGTAAVLMILKEAGAAQTSLEIISSAGSSGIMGLSLGTHGAYVHKITDSLQRAGMNVEVVKEIDNYETYQP
ncbi:MAG: hypothetical protein NWF01_11985 [Candidatus Bathyarchaeota archaeon]|nr:hypothetical protein [Candidatus Bathyarchaeota archaeon]